MELSSRPAPLGAGQSVEDAGGRSEDPPNRALPCRLSFRRSGRAKDLRLVGFRLASFGKGPKIPRGSMLKKAASWVIPILVITGLALGIWRWQASRAAPDVTYRTAPVEKRKIVARVTASGTLQATVTVQ